MRKLALVVALAACGDDAARHTPDAPHADGAADSTADAAVAPVTLTATRDGNPVAGVHVYFQNADSSVVLATTTDANGTASAVMAAGGYVTAVNPYTLPAFGVQSDELDTFAGVKPGDHLVLKRSFISTGVTVNMSGPGEVGLSGYSAYSPCNTAGTQLTPPAGLALAPGPVTGPMTLQNCGSANDFMIVATNGSGGMEFVYAPNQAVADQGTIDISGLTYGAATSRTLTYTNVPAQQSMSFRDTLVDPLGPMIEILSETPAGSNASATFDVPLFTGAVDVLQSYFNYTIFSQQVTADWGLLGSAATIDVGSRELYGFTGSPAFDATAKSASIAVDTSAGGAPDFSTFSVTASRSPRTWVWYVAAPYGASVALPTVPTDVFDFNIASTDTVNVNTWVNGKVPGGYDAVRAFVLSARPYLIGEYVSPQDLVIGGSGAATFAYSHPPPAVRRVLRHRTR